MFTGVVSGDELREATMLHRGVVPWSALLVSAWLCGPACSGGGDAAGGKHKPPPEWGAFEEVQGGTYRLPAPGKCKAIVLFFLGNDCPISNAFAPEVARLYREFSGKGVAFCA